MFHLFHVFFCAGSSLSVVSCLCIMNYDFSKQQFGRKKIQNKTLTSRLCKYVKYIKQNDLEMKTEKNTLEFIENVVFQINF